MKKLLSMLLLCAMVLGLATSAGAEITLGEEKPVLRILNYNVSYNPNETVEYKAYVDKTGYEAVYSILPSENATETLVMNMAGADKFDMCIIQGADQFSTLMTQGALLPLNDYIDAIAPEMWDCISKEAWSGVSDEDGNVYALPFVYPMPRELTSVITVRMDLVKAAGIDTLPTTVNSFYDFCKKLQDFYGDQYIILTGPYNKGTPGNIYNIPMCIAAGFGIYSDWMLDDDGKVIYMTEHKNFNAMIEYLNRLYNEKILDMDYAINTWSNADEKMSSGRAILEIHSRESINGMSKALFANFPELTEDDLAWIPILHDEEGNASFMESRQYWSYTVVPRSAAYNAAYVVDYAWKKAQNQTYLLIGEEGVHYTWDEDHLPIPIQPIFTDERNKANIFMSIGYEDQLSTLWAARLRKSSIMWKLYTACTLEPLANEPQVMVPSPFAYNNKPAYAEYNPQLLADLNVYLTQLVTGVKGLDSLNTFMNDWKVNGGEEVRAALTEWVNK